MTGHRIGPRALFAGLALGAALLLAGCQPDTADLPPVGEELMALQKARCEADGNIWGRAGSEGAFICFRRTRDGGERCSAAGDCSGVCLARSQTCSPFDPLIGCQEVLTASGARAMLCVD
jgi:hypothetical protein